MTVLRRVARNVADLQAAAAFYVKLGFSVEGDATRDTALAVCLGLTRVRSQMLRRREQLLELTECFPKGAGYPAWCLSNDLLFQHIAIVTQDIFAASAQAMQAGALAISEGGPERLPARAGGVIAWKFRDLDGHPCEFLQFPAASGKAASGYDHSAISVADVAASAAFYGGYGFRQIAAQVNHGVEQDRLDGLADVSVDVVALQGETDTPHIELLGYRRPVGRQAVVGLNDIAADRLVFGGKTGVLEVLRDPEGHVVLLDGR
jgi:catechol 2,3-dioxygenase-like lactoylglutathione lyase family enzyme